MAVLSITVVAWLTDCKITICIIANDYWCEFSELSLCEVADATLELFIILLE